MYYSQRKAPTRRFQATDTLPRTDSALLTDFFQLLTHYIRVLAASHDCVVQCLFTSSGIPRGFILTENPYSHGSCICHRHVFLSPVSHFPSVSQIMAVIRIRHRISQIHAVKYIKRSARLISSYSTLRKLSPINGFFTILPKYLASPANCIPKAPRKPILSGPNSGWHVFGCLFYISCKPLFR